MFRIFTSVLFFVTATLLVIVGLMGNMLSWLSAGLVVLLCTKGALSFLFFLRKKSVSVYRTVLSAHDWYLIASGYFTSATLFLISGIVGESWVGFLASLVIASVAFAFLFASKRAKAASNQSEHSAQQ